MPYSGDLGHPADRRRLVYWAKKRGHEIILDLNRKHDVLFLSSRADLTTWTERKNSMPLILDLVDGYLGKEHLLRDWVRGAGKVITGHNSGTLRPYRRIVSEACQLAQAVVCETVEQRETILSYCVNTHSILDFHEELPMLPFNREVLSEKFPALMWEGLPFTAKGLLLLEDPILRIAKSSQISLEVVTDPRYPLFLGKYFYQNTERILQAIPRKLGNHFRMTEWKLEAVVESAKRSHIAVLPLDPKGTLNPLKAENRLLMMWRIGLPTLASPSLAYRRVMKATLSDGICANSDEWYARIMELMDSVDRRQESVERGQQYIRDTHSERIVLEAWDRLFESVL
jgi:hypothetical protein